ncbi:MAG TPA: serine/threonine-protein kinase [Iamia sp.]|nr:serine/threonine-protein kinase [Iamia sp.]
MDGVLGRGGFGITYAATDLRLERPVAVKELFPEGARRTGTAIDVPRYEAATFGRARERFRREATTLARFGHPNIVRIFAVLEENDTAYLVLERIEGRTLAAELRSRQGPFTEPEALDVAAQAADALAAVHLAGVLHRDVSPSNLVRTPDGRVVLIDFGLARPFAMDRSTMMTRIVTPGYAPPEQHAGSGRFSPRADVYALGATLHRLLSGQTPPPAGERAHHDDLPPLWRINPTVSRRTSDAVAAALALDPAARPATVAVLLDRLGIAVEGLGAPDLVDLRDDPTTPPNGPARPSPDVVPATEVVEPAGAPPVAAAVAGDPDAPTVGPPDVPTDVVREYGPGVDAIGRSPRLGVPDAARPRDAGERVTEMSSKRAGGDDPATEVVSPIPSIPSIRSTPSLAKVDTAGPALAGVGPVGGSWVVPAPVPVSVGDDAEHPVRRLWPRERAVRPEPLSPGERLDLAAGAVPGGRRWVTLPLGLAATALASAQPATLVVILGLGAAPVLATVGDRVLQPHRNPAWWPLWWVRNVALGVVRSLGALLVLAVGLCLWFGTDAFDSLDAAGPWVLRATGLVAAGILALSIARGGPGFRSHVALDAVTRRLLPRGRPTLPSVVLLLVCIGVVAAGLAFQPEAWPLR